MLSRSGSRTGASFILDVADLSFYTEWLWMRMALRQEQHLLRESINKRRAKEGEDPVKLEPRKVAKEIASALGGPFAR